MKFRVFNKKYNLYTTDVSYPLNQRTFSTFAINEDGELLEIVHCEGGKWVEKAGDEYVIEYSTGLKDRIGNEIYENDVLYDSGEDKEVKIEKHQLGFLLRGLNHPLDGYWITDRDFLKHMEILNND